jgi:hypothetical protein
LCFEQILQRDLLLSFSYQWRDRLWEPSTRFIPKGFNIQIHLVLSSLASTSFDPPSLYLSPSAKSSQEVIVFIFDFFTSLLATLPSKNKILKLEATRSSMHLATADPVVIFPFSSSATPSYHSSLIQLITVLTVSSKQLIKIANNDDSQRCLHHIHMKQ